MYYLVHMDHNSMAAQRAVYPMKLMGLVMICFGMTMKRMRMLGVSVRKMKALNVMMEMVTMIGKGKYNLTCYVY